MFYITQYENSKREENFGQVFFDVFFFFFFREIISKKKNFLKISKFSVFLYPLKTPFINQVNLILPYKHCSLNFGVNSL